MSDRTDASLAGSQMATPMIKVVVPLSEAAFLDLPDTLDSLLRPAIMQLNTTETAVELFYLQPATARAIVAALAALTPAILAEMVAESVLIPIGRALPLTHPFPIGTPVKVPANNRSQLDLGELTWARAGKIGGWWYSVRWPDGSVAEYPMEQVSAEL